MRSRRPLQAELLERRQLLSADLSPATIPLAESELAESELYAASAFVAHDAGSSFRSAADIGSIEGSRSFRGSLGFYDPADTIAFTVDRAADVQIDLSRMRTNADLYLTDGAGRIISTSRRSGRLPESLDVDLEAGQYYITVLAASYWSNQYRLTITAELAAAPPALPPSILPPSILPHSSGINFGRGSELARDPGDTGSDDSPSTVDVLPAPLADVAYYGGSNDWNINLIAAPEAWAAGYTGQGVTIAVVDSGVDLDHPDLVRNLYVNPGEIPGNGIDDDGNGFIDDRSGYDFADNDADPNDRNGHGTHVAGTIAAASNGFGATGVAPDAKILPVRVLGANGSGSSLDVAAGIRYAADMGAQIINLSLGGGYSSAIDSAIRYAQGVGALIVAAAGNESASVPGYPARFSSSYDNVISVGAHNSSSSIAGFSNRVGSSGAAQVDAPGVGIYSTYVGGGFAMLSGTSMAAPHVAGLAALALSAQPNLTASQLRNLLIGGVNGAARGSDAIGIVNATTTVAYAAAGLTTITGPNQPSVAREFQQSINSGSRSWMTTTAFNFTTVTGSDYSSEPTLGFSSDTESAFDSEARRTFASAIGEESSIAMPSEGTVRPRSSAIDSEAADLFFGAVSNASPIEWCLADLGQSAGNLIETVR